VFQGPVTTGADFGKGDSEVIRPAEKRREGIEDQLRAWEMLLHCQHQRLDLRFFKVHQNTLGQKEKGRFPADGSQGDVRSPHPASAIEH